MGRRWAGECVLGAEVFFDIREIRLVWFSIRDVEKRVYFIGLAVVRIGLVVGLEPVETAPPGVRIKVVVDVPVADCSGRLKPAAGQPAFRRGRRDVVKAIPWTAEQLQSPAIKNVNARGVKSGHENLPTAEWLTTATRQLPWAPLALQKSLGRVLKTLQRLQ